MVELTTCTETVCDDKGEEKQECSADPPLSHLLGIWGTSHCTTASHFVYIVMTEDENAEMEKQHQNNTCLRQEQNWKKKSQLGDVYP